MFMMHRIFLTAGALFLLSSVSSPAAAEPWRPTLETKAWKKFLPKLEAGLKLGLDAAMSIRLVNLQPIRTRGNTYSYGSECRLEQTNKAVVVGLYRDRQQSVALLRLTESLQSDFTACPRNALFLMSGADIQALLERQAKRQAMEEAEKDIVRQILNDAK